VAAVERCLAKDPAQRPQSGEDLAAALATTLDTRRDLPVPVRTFLAEIRSGTRGQLVATWASAAVLIPTGLSLLVRAVFPAGIPGIFTTGITAVALGLGAVALLSPVVWEVRRVRRLLGAGYRREDLLQGLRLEMERRREEQEYADHGEGGRSTRWERLMSRKAYGSMGVAVLAAVASFFVPYPAVLGVFGVFGLSCAAAVATGLAAHAAGRGRLGFEEETHLRFWDGRIGRWLVKLAGFGLKRSRPALPATDRPTEVALGLAALDLFEALPKETRQQLGDLPAVVRGLEERVRRLRGNGQEARLRDALGALEVIRFDLLRLQGGVGTLEGLTADLGAARVIGEKVDALLEGHREVEEAL